jgi:hypothetical protein
MNHLHAAVVAAILIAFGFAAGYSSRPTVTAWLAAAQPATATTKEPAPPKQPATFLNRFADFQTPCSGTIAEVDSCLRDRARYEKTMARVGQFDPEALREMGYCAARGCPTVRSHKLSACTLTLIYSVVEGLPLVDAERRVGGDPCAGADRAEILRVRAEIEQEVPIEFRRKR